MAQIAEELVDEIFEIVESTVPANVATVFRSCFSNTLESTLEYLSDGTVYMVTGDIPAMWLRDSTAQLGPYLHFAARDEAIADMIAAVLERQLQFILIDPYANAFNREPNGHGHDDHPPASPWVWERKYEIDSLCYPVQLAHDLWKITGRTAHLNDTFREAAATIVRVLRTEQHHEDESAYRFQRLDGPITDTLARDGRGGLVRPNGLTWSGFRPSDDACELGYNIPANAFATVELAHIAEIARGVLDDPELAAEASALSDEIGAALAQHGTAVIGDAAIYAYEVDGLGSALLMDDANAPSLLSMPLFGWCATNDPLYLATRQFVLSPGNPYFYSGREAAGVGSPHTPRGHVWPIALAVQGLTAVERTEQLAILDLLSTTHAGTGLMHESFHVDAQGTYTREWFSWANSMFCELVLEVCGLRRQRAVLAIGATL